MQYICKLRRDQWTIPRIGPRCHFECALNSFIMMLFLSLLLPATLCAGRSKQSMSHFLKWMAGLNHGHALKEEKVKQLLQDFQAVNGHAEVTMEDLFNQLMNSGFTEDDLEDINGDNTFLQFLRWVATGHKNRKGGKKPSGKAPEAPPTKNVTSGTQTKTSTKSTKSKKSTKTTKATKTQTVTTPTTTTPTTTTPAPATTAETKSTVPPKLKRLHRRHRHHHRHHHHSRY